MSYESIALVDRVAKIIDPEELWNLRELVHWADEHGYSPVAQLTPIVGDDARFVHQVIQCLDAGYVEQTEAAGVPLAERDAIEYAWESVPTRRGQWARWEAALSAASRWPTVCEAWAALADVALAMDWAPDAVTMRELKARGLTEPLRAAVAVRAMADGADCVEAWSEAVDAVAFF